MDEVTVERKCILCSTWQPADSYELHLREELDYAPWRCRICRFSFFARQDAVDHFSGPAAAHPKAAVSITERFEPAIERRLAALLRGADLPPPTPPFAGLDPAKDAHLGRSARPTPLKFVWPQMTSAAVPSLATSPPPSDDDDESLATPAKLGPSELIDLASPAKEPVSGGAQEQATPAAPESPPADDAPSDEDASTPPPSPSELVETPASQPLPAPEEAKAKETPTKAAPMESPEEADAKETPTEAAPMEMESPEEATKEDEEDMLIKEEEPEGETTLALMNPSLVRSKRRAKKEPSAPATKKSRPELAEQGLACCRSLKAKSLFGHVSTKHLSGVYGGICRLCSFTVPFGSLTGLHRHAAKAHPGATVAGAIEDRRVEARQAILDWLAMISASPDQ